MTPTQDTQSTQNAPVNPQSTNPQNYDTVENAAATPDQAMPWQSLGLKADEYERICTILGRRPTNAELAMYSVMWSEHCSYKSSKKHLGEQFGKKTTPAMKEKLLVGMGQNAGVVDVGEGLAVTFKVESHNHPSFVEPYQGAATGVGGIVRDIISMGARPVACMDQLRFGDPQHPDTARVVHGVVAGVGGYGNCLGLPNIGGETEFDPSYQGNPLVNALCVGVLRHEDIHLANAQGVGNHVVLFGARTGGDGIGGASILASESFDEGMPTKRPSVQVGDPFMEKVLIECCLELFEAKVVAAIQDLGAAGISCATSELAANGDSGMHVHLENVLLRDPTLTAGEILMSESQERMMAVVEPRHLQQFEEILQKWDVEYALIGQVTDDGRLTIDHHGQRIVDVDPKTVAIDSPVYDRPYAHPAWQDALVADTVDVALDDGRLSYPQNAAQLQQAIVDVAVKDPNAASKAWVTRQYDHYVQGNTALAMPDDAGVIRVNEENNRGVAIATDANGWYTKLDPRQGARQALAESYRNVATVGATPLAITNCLNFGSPEDPDAMWQLVEAMTGLADGCAQLGVPVTGGNVSLYNSSGKEKSQIDSSINPTPVVGMLGVMEDVRRAVPSGIAEEGLQLVLLGETKPELDGSAWARWNGHFGGVPPQVDLAKEEKLARVLIWAANTDSAAQNRLSETDMVDNTVSTVEGSAPAPATALPPIAVSRAAHDLSNGGLAAALVDMVTRFGVGASINLERAKHNDGVDNFELLFSESQARALVAVRSEDLEALGEKAASEGIAAVKIGTTGGELLAIELGEAQGVISLDVAELRQQSERVLPGFFG